MLSFKLFISEIWIKPKAETERKEIPFQANVKEFPDHVRHQLNYLANPNNFKRALSSAKIEQYDAEKVKNVNNTDASDPNSFKGLNPEKQKRVTGILNRNRGVETPIILRHKETGHEHLLSGNTRATGAMNISRGFKASVIEY